MPQVGDILYGLAGLLFCSTLDLKSGYWQILVDEADRWETAFVCKSGVFQWVGMPFVLKKAPCFFQCLTDHLHRASNPAHVKAYLDDIAMRANTEDEMMLRLQLHTPLREMPRFQPKIGGLGHVFHRHGIYPLDKIIGGIRKSSRPQAKDDIRAAS